MYANLTWTWWENCGLLFICLNLSLVLSLINWTNTFHKKKKCVIRCLWDPSVEELLLIDSRQRLSFIEQQLNSCNCVAFYQFLKGPYVRITIFIYKHKNQSDTKNFSTKYTFKHVYTKINHKGDFDVEYLTTRADYIGVDIMIYTFFTKIDTPLL